jgi:hypothetical protein
MLKEFYFAVGGFAAGFTVCWFFVAKIKQDIAKLRTDVVLALMPNRPNVTVVNPKTSA